MQTLNLKSFSNEYVQRVQTPGNVYIIFTKNPVFTAKNKLLQRQYRPTISGVLKALYDVHNTYQNLSNMTVKRRSLLHYPVFELVMDYEHESLECCFCTFFAIVIEGKRDKTGNADRRHMLMG